MTRTRRTKGTGTHGQLKGGAKPPEYAIWKMMIQRCYNPSSREYFSYGGAGIRVCDRWQEAEGYQNFLADLGPQPFKGAGLVRKDKEGDYSKENVEWGNTRGKLMTYQ